MIYCRKETITFKCICAFIAFFLLVTLFVADIIRVQNTDASVLGLPEPTAMLSVGTIKELPSLKGIRINPDNPLDIEFIVDSGTLESVTKEEASVLVQYFLAGLTIPKKDFWVNLSPYEHDRIIDDELALTKAGKDILAQDYILKQVSSSLTHPKTQIGQAYWSLVNSNKLIVNSDTFNKIWITPERAAVYEDSDKNITFITDASLKVLSEEDYLASNVGAQHAAPGIKSESQIASASDSLISEITREVNEGDNFAKLRQIYHSLILASWFKEKLKKSVLNSYINKKQVSGIDTADPSAKEKIWKLYCESFNKGVYNFIKRDSAKHYKNKRRRFFSGGVVDFIPEVSSSMSDQKEFDDQLVGVPYKFDVVLAGIDKLVSSVKFPFANIEMQIALDNNASLIWNYCERVLKQPLSKEISERFIGFSINNNKFWDNMLSYLHSTTQMFGDYNKKFKDGQFESFSSFMLDLTELLEKEFLSLKDSNKSKDAALFMARYFMMVEAITALKENYVAITDSQKKPAYVDGARELALFLYAQLQSSSKKQMVDPMPGLGYLSEILYGVELDDKAISSSLETETQKQELVEAFDPSLSSSITKQNHLYLTDNKYTGGKITDLIEMYGGVLFEELNALNKDAKVLLIGPGLGKEVLGLRKQFENLSFSSVGREDLFMAEDGVREQDVAYLKNAFVKADLDDGMPYKDGEFDSIILGRAVMPYIQDKLSFIKEIYRSLKPKGVAFVAIPTMELQEKEVLTEETIDIQYTDVLLNHLEKWARGKKHIKVYNKGRGPFLILKKANSISELFLPLKLEKNFPYNGEHYQTYSVYSKKTELGSSSSVSEYKIDGFNSRMNLDNALGKVSSAINFSGAELSADGITYETKNGIINFPLDEDVQGRENNVASNETIPGSIDLDGVYLGHIRHGEKVKEPLQKIIVLPTHKELIAVAIMYLGDDNRKLSNEIGELAEYWVKIENKIAGRNVYKKTLKKQIAVKRSYINGIKRYFREKNNKDIFRYIRQLREGKRFDVVEKVKKSKSASSNINGGVDMDFDLELAEGSSAIEFSDAGDIDFSRGISFTIGSINKIESVKSYYSLK